MSETTYITISKEQLNDLVVEISQKTAELLKVQTAKPSEAETETYLTLKEVATKYKVCLQTVRNHVKRNNLIPIRLGKRLALPMSQVNALLHQYRHKQVE